MVGHSSVTLGLYMSYNFGMPYDTEKLNTKGSTTCVTLNLEKYGSSSLDIGTTFGFYLKIER